MRKKGRARLILLDRFLMDYAPAQAYIKRTVKARIQHKCCECLGAILPAETYIKHSGVWDGRGMSYKNCVDCEQLRIDIEKSEQEGFVFEGLREWICENHILEFMKRFAVIKEKRGVKVPSYLENELDILLNAEDDRIALEQDAHE